MIPSFCYWEKWRKDQLITFTLKVNKLNCFGFIIKEKRSAKEKKGKENEFFFFSFLFLISCICLWWAILIYDCTTLLPMNWLTEYISIWTILSQYNLIGESTKPLFLYSITIHSMETVCYHVQFFYSLSTNGENWWKIKNKKKFITFTFVIQCFIFL